MDHPWSRQKGAAGLGRHRLPWAVVLAVVLVLASVTDKLADFATNVVGDLGLPGIFLLMVRRERLHPDPVGGDDAVRRASTSTRASTRCGRPSLVGSVANLVGSWIAYAVGYYGRLELLEKHGKFLHITPAHLECADRWFERYGAPAVFFSRMLPIVRTFISLPAGVARMPFWRFSVLTLPGLPALGLRADLRRQEGGRELDGLEGLACTTSTTRSPCSSSWAPSTSSSAGGATATAGAPRMRRPERRARAAPRAGARGAARARRAAAHLLLGAHRRWSRGCSAGPTPSSTPSCARPSRSRCTPAPRRRCSSACATRSASAARGLDRRRAVLIAGLVRAAGHRRLHARAPDRAAPGHAAHDRRRACCSAPRRWPPPTRSGRRARRREEAGLADALALGVAQACALDPRRLAQRHDAGRGARCAASTAPTPTRSRATSRCRSSSGRPRSKGVRLARRGLPPALASAFAAGIGAAFVSTLASRAHHPRGGARPLVRALRRLPRGARGRGAPARLAESRAMSDVLRRRRRRHRRGRPRRRRPRRRPAHDRARPARASVLPQRPLRVGPARGPEPRDRALDRRRRLEDRRRRAGRPPRDGRHRLRRDERQRRRLRRRRADRAARLPGRRAGRPGRRWRASRWG